MFRSSSFLLLDGSFLHYQTCSRPRESVQRGVSSAMEMQKRYVEGSSRTMIQVQLRADQVEAIAERLKDTPLKLPRSLGDHPAAATKQEYLASLLSRDTGVFLERHGEALNTNERALFEPLRTGSFEVEFYMRQLEQTDANQHNSSSADRATVRNRRLAKLNRIEADEFFSEV